MDLSPVINQFVNGQFKKFWNYFDSVADQRTDHIAKSLKKIQDYRKSDTNANLRMKTLNLSQHNTDRTRSNHN